MMAASISSKQQQQQQQHHNGNGNGNTKSSKKSDSKLLSLQWNRPHFILLGVILMQGIFMICMNLQGPTGLHSHAQMAPHNNHNNNNMISNRGWKSTGQTKQQEDQLRQRFSGGGSAAKKTTVVPPVKAPHDSSNNKKKDSKPKKIQATSPPQYKAMVQGKDWDANAQDFPGALHLHFAQEQKDPSFRAVASNSNSHSNQQQQHWEQAEQDAHEKMVKQNLAIKSCQYYDPNTGQIRVKQECFNSRHKKPNKGIIAYNSQPFPRTWCGKSIKPYSVQHFQKWCNMTEPARLLLPDSDALLGTQRRDLKHLPPIVFERTGSPENAKVEFVQDCDVPCKFTMDTCVDATTAKLQKGQACLPPVSDWTVQGTDFKFKYSMMDPRDEHEVAISRKGYREHQYYATRSFRSEIPLSTFDWDRYGNITPKNNFKKAGERGICFVRLEPCSGEIRPATWVNKVEETFKGNFDNYGPCKYPKTKIKETKLDMTKSEDRQSVMSQYMFTLVIGNSQTPDVISELVWDALQAGSIPVYVGNPNIREHVPLNSIIVGGEYSSREAMAEYLDKVKGSKAAWERYHAWRDDEKSALMEDKYGFLKAKSSSSFCRMCRWALATQYSLGWDHEKQAIRGTSLDKKFCVSKKDVLKGPFEELWTSDLGAQRSPGAKDCNRKTSAFQTIVFDEVSLDRTVTSHDNGVVDMAITDLKSSDDNRLKVVLRIDFKNAIRNANGAHIIQPHQLMLKEESPSGHIPLVNSIAIQDGSKRVTILTNWITDLTTPKQEGIVDILVKNLKKSSQNNVGEQPEPDEETGFVPRLMKDEVLRIRFIMEDVNLLRDVTTEYSVSPFARTMMRDFLDPLMFFDVI